MQGISPSPEQRSATIGTTLVGACVALTNINVVFRFAFTGPAIAIESSMACRVFRTVALRPVAFAEEFDLADTSPVLMTTRPPAFTENIDLGDTSPVLMTTFSYLEFNSSSEC